MIVILRRFLENRLRNKCLLYLPSHSHLHPLLTPLFFSVHFFSIVSSLLSLLQRSFFFSRQIQNHVTTGFNTLMFIFIFISSFIFILPFLSYLSRVFYFPNFILFFLLPVPLLLLEFRQSCSMLRRVHAAVAEATTRAVSIVLAPTSVSRTASSPSPTSAAS